jgi:hypothetical protein
MRQFTVAMCACSISNRFHGNTSSHIYIDQIYETVPLEKGEREVRVRKEQRKEIKETYDEDTRNNDLLFNFKGSFFNSISYEMEYTEYEVRPQRELNIVSFTHNFSAQHLTAPISVFLIGFTG